MAGLRGSIAMSLTRPPIAAGSIDRALKFLKRMSINFGGVDCGTGESVEGEVGVVSDDAAGEAVVAPGRAPIRAGDGVCAWRATMQPKLMKGMAVDLIDTISRISAVAVCRAVVNPWESEAARRSPNDMAGDPR
jgi:hypothetical protein